MALAIDVIRFGPQRDLWKMRQDFSLATPRSTGARAAASTRLRVFSVGVSSCRGPRLMPVLSHGPAPGQPLTPKRSPAADRPAGKIPMEDHFGAAIRRFRLRARLTQEALAERSGVSVSTIRGMETGTRRNPQLASVRRLADALELRPAEQDEPLAAAAGSAEPAAIPAPCRLPAPPAPLVGGHDELDRLDATLPSGSGASSTVVISAIAGAGGVGKSWRVLHWAHRNADRFPTGNSSSTYGASASTATRWSRPWRYVGSSTRWASSPSGFPSPRTLRRRCSAAWWRTSGCCWCSTKPPIAPRSPPAAGRRHPHRGGHQPQPAVGPDHQPWRPPVGRRHPHRHRGPRASRNPERALSGCGGAAWSRSRGAKMRARIESAGRGPGRAHSGGWHRITTMVQAVLVRSTAMRRSTQQILPGWAAVALSRSRRSAKSIFSGLRKRRQPLPMSWPASCSANASRTSLRRR